MRADVLGEGAPVIVLHEWLGDHRNWRPLLEHCDLTANTFHCIDLPGYGHSFNATALPSIEAVSDYVLDYAAQEGFNVFSLAVHSMTGLVGHHLSSTSSDRLDALIYFCPVPPNGFRATLDDIEKMRHLTEDRAMLRQGILARGGHLESEKWLKNKEGIAWSASSAETKRAYLQMFLAPVSPPSGPSQMKAVTVICGDEDLPFYRKPSLEREFKPYYGNINLISLANCGHYPMLQVPEAAANVLEESLAIARRTPVHC